MQTKKIIDGQSKVLVFNEKHGSDYYIVSSEEELHKACCQVLARRLEEGWYGEIGQDPPINRTGFVDGESLNSMPEGEIKTLALREWDNYQRKLKWYKENQSFLKDVLTVLEYTFNPEDKYWTRNKAYDLISSRTDYEYEYAELIIPSKING